MYPRTIATVLLGLALWGILFFALGVSIGLLWPEYREAARVMMQERSFRLFTASMLCVNYLLFAVAGLAVGWAATAFAKTSRAALAIAALLLVYAAAEHYLLLWSKLPGWYNLTVPIVICVFVWLGGKLATTRPTTA